MPVFNVKLSKTVRDLMTGWIEVEAANTDEAREKALAAAYNDEVEFKFNYSLDSDDAVAEVQGLVFEALLPDGTRCEWDERLRIVGALRVPKE